MEFLCDIWQTLLGWWDFLWGMPTIEMQDLQPEPLDPREKIHDIGDLTKIIYFFRPETKRA